MAGTAYICFEEVPLHRLPPMEITDEDVAYVIAVMESEGRIEAARELEQEWLNLRSKP